MPPRHSFLVVLYTRAERTTVHSQVSQAECASLPRTSSSRYIVALFATQHPTCTLRKRNSVEYSSLLEIFAQISTKSLSF